MHQFLVTITITLSVVSPFQSVAIGVPSTRDGNILNVSSPQCGAPSSDAPGTLPCTPDADGNIALTITTTCADFPLWIAWSQRAGGQVLTDTITGVPRPAACDVPRTTLYFPFMPNQR